MKQFGTEPSLCLTQFWFVVSVQRFDVMIEALEKGQAVDLSELPPSPDQGEEEHKSAAHNQASLTYTCLLMNGGFKRNRKREYTKRKTTGINKHTQKLQRF